MAARSAPAVRGAGAAVPRRPAREALINVSSSPATDNAKITGIKEGIAQFHHYQNRAMSRFFHESLKIFRRTAEDSPRTFECSWGQVSPSQQCGRLGECRGMAGPHVSTQSDRDRGRGRDQA